MALAAATANDQLPLCKAFALEFDGFSFVKPSGAVDELYFLKFDGEAGRLIREFDWLNSPLGAPSSWPAHLRTAVDMMLHSRFPKALIWGPELITLHNDAFKPLLGEKPSAIGRPFREVWAEAWDEIGPIAERAFQGEPTFIEDFPLVIDRHGYTEQCYFTFCYSPIRDETGKVAGIMDTIIETSSTVNAQKQLETINDELAHRMRNLITIVSSLTIRSLSLREDNDKTIETLRGRFSALAQVQATLDRRHMNSADMRNLIDNALAPHSIDRNRLAVSGPSLQVDENQATALALALNELTTNAVKYGSWSKRKGRVEISWSMADGEFVFNWREKDGPMVMPPERAGYGSELMERYVAHTFAGEAKLHFDPNGLRYELRAPLKAVRPD